MGGQKKLYQRWLTITEKTKLINECKIVGNVFLTINQAIKSVVSNVFADNKSSQLMLDALNKIYLNCNLGLG